MTCQDVERLAGAYHDGELDAERALAIEEHASTCAACTAKLAALRSLSESLRTVPAYRAPARLAARVRRRPHWWRWVVPAVGIAAIVLVGISLYVPGPGRDAIEQTVVDAHLRSLMANHLSDVISSDRHTVKPWFAGRLDFSPVVADLARDGFPLAGGRLDYIDRHPAAALVYKRRDHVINVFMWPVTSGQPARAALTDPRGFHLITWTRRDMTVWVVSDLAADELQEFAGRLDAAMVSAMPQ